MNQQIAALGYATGRIWFVVSFVVGWILQLIAQVFEATSPSES